MNAKSVTKEEVKDNYDSTDVSPSDKYMMRPGNPSDFDASHRAEFANIAADGGYEKILGSNWRNMLESIYKCDDTVANYKNTYFLVNSSDQNEIAGSITLYSYDWKQKYGDKEDSKYGEQFSGCCQVIKAIIGVIFFWFMGLSDLGKPEKDETYIETIAIYKQYRGQKLSKKILKYATEIALKQHQNCYLSLHVDVKNKIATNAYLKDDFEIDKRYCKTGRCCFCCCKTLYRMTKSIK